MIRLLRPLLIVVSACLFTLNGLPARAQVLTLAHFGRVTANGTLPSVGIADHFRRASRFTLTEPGTAQELCVYVDGQGGGPPRYIGESQFFRLALFSDVNGRPAKRLAGAFQALGVMVGDAPKWLCQYIDPIPYLAAGPYWIALIDAGFESGTLRTYSTDSGQGSFTTTGDASSIPLDMFGSGRFETGTMAAYVRYYPASQLRVAGRTNVGTLASQPMTANYKRVSSFDLPVRARIYEISHYIDSLGAPDYDGPPMSQGYRTVLYRDSNGAPGQRVYEDSEDINVDVFQLPRWRSMSFFQTPGRHPMTLEAGRYWIGYLSGAPFGDPALDLPSTLRYYYDHTGQWYGNANAFSVHASTPFGSGTAKNDSISAFVSYHPASAPDAIGRTDIATDPSRGLTPDVTRWSEFLYTDAPSTLTGLHAYLDGKGATSGSQAVRMVIYELRYGTDEQGNATASWFLVAKSDAVTIPAGMSAKWVDFKVQAATLDPPFFTNLRIGIQSSGPVPVVRDYGDTRQAFTFVGASRPDTFVDGPDLVIPDIVSTRIPVSLSVYATYRTP